MRSTRAAALLAVTAVVSSLGWLWLARGGGTTVPPVPDGYALDLVTHVGRYWTDAAALGDAEEKLVRECMRRRGFAPAPRPGTATAPSHGEIAGVDLGYRRDHGYGLAESTATAPEPEPPAPPPGYDEAMTGGTSITVRVGGVPAVVVASGGCQGNARAALAGSVERWAAAVYVPDFLNDDLIRAVAADPARPRLLRGWRACMAAHGYRFGDYAEPRAFVQKRLDQYGPAPRIAAEERRLAVADGACLVEGRVIETGIAMRRAAASAMPAEWTRALRHAARARHAAVDNAHRVLGTGA